MLLRNWGRLAFVAGLAVVSLVGCRTSNGVSDQKGMKVANSDGSHDLYLWVTSKEFGGDNNICLFFNQTFPTTSSAADPNWFESFVYKGSDTHAWNLNYVPWNAYRRAFIATAQKLHKTLSNGGTSLSFRVKTTSGDMGTKTIKIDANKYVEFLSWFMTDLHGRAPDKVDVKSMAIFDYMYAVMDNIDDKDQISSNQCGKSSTKDPRNNTDVSDADRMDLYNQVHGQLKSHLTGGWATGESWYKWSGDFKSPQTEAKNPSTNGCNPANDTWMCYWNTKKEDRPAILSTLIRGVGKSTAEKMVDAGAFKSKPKTWDDFKAEIKRLSKTPGLSDLYDNVVGKFGSSNKDKLEL